MNDILIVARKVRKLSAGQVASEIGIALQEYEKLESGESKVSFQTAERLSSLYDLEVEYFLKERGRVVNFNSGASSKGIVNAENYNETRDSEFERELISKLVKEKDSQINFLKRELENIKND